MRDLFAHAADRRSSGVIPGKDSLTMPNHVVHFAVHADDVERARAFYEGAFG